MLGGIVLLGALLLMGCASAKVVRFPKAGAELTCITPAAQQDTVVGVSFSGGGSRATIFGGAGLEALLLRYLQEINQLRTRPQWFNALTDNCTSDSPPRQDERAPVVAELEALPERLTRRAGVAFILFCSPRQGMSLCATALRANVPVKTLADHCGIHAATAQGDDRVAADQPRDWARTSVP